MANGTCYVAFQKPISVHGYDSSNSMYGRTFEEAFVYQNIQLFRENQIGLGIGFPASKDFEAEYEAVFERVKSSSFKKTEFALDVASSTADWVTPQYIVDGLRWLEEKTVKKNVAKMKVIKNKAAKKTTN